VKVKKDISDTLLHQRVKVKVDAVEIVHQKVEVYVMRQSEILALDNFIEN